MEDDGTDFNVRKLLVINIKQYRSDMHMSQLDLANSTGLAHNYINDIEHERKWPSSDTIAKLAKALKKEPYQLFIPEEKWGIKGAEFFIQELSGSIATIVREKCDQYIMDSNDSESNNQKRKQK